MRTSQPDDADRALIARVADEDEAAHRVLFDSYYPRVFSFVARRLGDESLSEEVVADVFFEVWRSAAPVSYTHLTLPTMCVV